MNKLIYSYRISGKPILFKEKDMKNLAGIVALVVLMVTLMVGGVSFAADPVIGVEGQTKAYPVMIVTDITQADFSVEEDVIEQGEWLGMWVVYYQKVYIPELKNLLSRLTVTAKFESARGLREVQIDPIEELGDGFVCIVVGEEFHYPNGDIYEYTYDWAGKPAYIIVGEYVKQKMTSPIIHSKK